MRRTPFVETEALLIATEDAEADSGAFAVDEYLREHFTPGELERLERAAEVLSHRCVAVRLQLEEG